MVPVAVSSARAAPPIKTARHTTSVQFVSGFIPHLLTLASVARMSEAKSGGNVRLVPGYRFAHPGYDMFDVVIARSDATKQSERRHSGMVR